MMKGLLFFIKFSWKERKSYIIMNAVSQLLIGILPIAIKMCIRDSTTTEFLGSTAKMG